MARLILEEDDYHLESKFVILNGMIREPSLEKAPPKYWRPACFMVPILLQETGCPGYENGTSKACCECPYREVKE